MIHTLILEVHKLRRLHIIRFILLTVIGVVFLSTVGIWSSQLQLIPQHGHTSTWAELLYNYTFITIMLSPWMVSVLSSRQIEIEHDANGWNMARTIGISPLNLCIAKSMMVSALLAIALFIQTIAVMVIGSVVGLEGSIGMWHWVQYTVGLMVLNLVFTGFHIYLSAAVPSQLLSVGIGLLGSFIGIYWVLQPSQYALLTPWGYYAKISQILLVDHHAQFYQPNMIIPLIFVVVCIPLELFAIYRLSASVR